jgi:ribosomal-protein-alanine acetyltransferase
MDAPVARSAEGTTTGRGSHAQPSASGRGGDDLIGRISRFLRPAPEPPSPELEEELRSIVGYAGIWVMTDEAHITTIASHPDVRGQGVGEFLLVALVHRAIAIGARWMTLEVRASNAIAQNLYRKYTFKEMGVRRRYYSDNGEDALVMWTDALDSESFQAALDTNEQRLGDRLGSAEVRLGGNVWSLRNG